MFSLRTDANLHALVSPNLIGREEIFDALVQLVDRARQADGAYAATLVTGEAGIGKSRLVAQVERYAADKQFVIWHGNSFEQERSLPYAPLRDLTSRKPTSNNRETDSPLRSLFMKFSAPAYGSISTDPAELRHRLFDAVLDRVVNVAHIHPLLIVLEDLHWSDEATFELLLYLVRRTRTLPIVYLFTFRHEEVAPALRHLLAEFEREHLTIEFSLMPFTREQVGTMLGAMFQQAQPVRSDFVEAIYTLTDGNPFFIEEVCKVLVMSGDIFATPGGWSRKAVPELQIPHTIQDAVAKLTERLSPAARNVLERAAIVGRSVRFALLGTLMQMNESELLAHLKELFAAQLLVEESADEVAFRHELTRQAVYSSLLLRERRTFHREVAETIERTDVNAPEMHAAELAYHFDQGQVWQKAFEYSLRAGEQARALYAPRAAVEQYSRALHAAQQLQRAFPIGVLRARGGAYETLGDFDSARADFDQVLAQSQSAGDLYSEWQAQLDLGFLWIGRDLQRAGEFFRRALEQARALDNSTTLAQTLNRLGNWHMMVEQPLQARIYHVEALQLFRAMQDQRGVAETLDLLGTTSISAADIVEGIEYYQQAIVSFRDLENQGGLASALSMLALTTRQYLSSVYFMPLEDRGDAALANASEALEIVRRIGWRAGESLVQTILGMIYGMRGNYAHALPAMKTALSIAQEIGHQQWLVTSHLALGGLYQDLLDLPAAQQHFENALSAARATGSLYWTRSTAGFLASTLISQGELEKANLLLQELLLPEMPAVTMGERHLWTAHAEFALAKHDAKTALAAIERQIHSSPYAKTSGENAVPRLALLRANALAVMGEEAAARQILQDALNASILQNTPPMTWRVHAALAHLALATGRRDDALRAQADAHQIVESLAAAIPDAALAEKFMQHATAQISPEGASPARTAARQGFGGLTGREREVATLISQGKTNRAIAEQLVLSDRTVEKHVENIMSKLGFDARTQIAAWAVEMGLKGNVSRNDT